MYTYGILKTNISQTRVAQAKLMPGPTWPDQVNFFKRKNCGHGFGFLMNG